MGWVNLTQGTVTLVRPEGNVQFPPSGQVATIGYAIQQVGWQAIEGRNVPVCQQVAQEVYGLPAPIAGTCFIVDPEVAEAVARRTDVFYPEGAVMDQAGNRVGCWGLGVKKPRSSQTPSKEAVHPLKRAGQIVKTILRWVIIIGAVLIITWIVAWIRTF